MTDVVLTFTVRVDEKRSMAGLTDFSERPHTEHLEAIAMLCLAQLAKTRVECDCERCAAYTREVKHLANQFEAVFGVSGSKLVNPSETSA